MEKYKQIALLGISSFPHPISNDLRDKVIKFSINNAITCEEHPKKFINMINGYEVEQEDVVMKFFVHSLTKDAKDYFRRLPNDSVASWSVLEKLFKEKYGDNTNAKFVLNEFNNIKKGENESTFDFNVRFQKGMYKLLQVMRLNEDVCLITYFNSFDCKMAYSLRDKDPKTLREVY